MASGEAGGPVDLRAPGGPNIFALYEEYRQARDAGDTETYAALGEILRGLRAFDAESGGRRVFAELDPPFPDQAPPMGRDEAALRGAAQGATLGWSDELGSAMEAAIGEGPAGKPYGERYAALRDEARSTHAKAQADQPQSYLAGNVAGGVVSSLPAMAVSGGGSIPVSMARLGGLGAAYGAASGAGLSESDTAGGVASDAGQGAAVGGLVSMGAPLVGPLARLAARGVGRGAGALSRLAFRPALDRGAQELAAQGVPLTVGQAMPKSVVGRLEQATQYTPWGLRVEREAAEQAFRDKAIENEVTKRIGKALPAGRTTQETLDATHALFSEPDVYGVLKGRQIYPAAGGVPLQGTKRAAGAMEQAAAGVNTTLPVNTREGLLRFVRNEATALSGKQNRPVGALARIEAERAKDVRSALRTAAREAQDPREARVLKAAEKKVTEALETQLGPDAAEKLRRADAAYARLATIDEAAKSAAVQGGNFTPGQLIRAAGDSTSTDLGRWGYAGQTAFQSVPQTGVTGLVAKFLDTPITKNIPVGLVSRGLNYGPFRAGLTGLPANSAPFSLGFGSGPRGWTAVSVAERAYQQALANALRKQAEEAEPDGSQR